MAENERRRRRRANVALDAQDFISAELVNDMDLIDQNNRTNPYARGADNDFTQDSIELGLVANQPVPVRNRGHRTELDARLVQELNPASEITGRPRNNSSATIVEADSSKDSIVFG